MQSNLGYLIAVLKKAFDAFDQEKQGYIDAAMVSDNELLNLITMT